jgi:hypothetical protein
VAFFCFCPEVIFLASDGLPTVLNHTFLIHIIFETIDRIPAI